MELALGMPHPSARLPGKDAGAAALCTCLCMPGSFFFFGNCSVLQFTRKVVALAEKKAAAKV